MSCCNSRDGDITKRPGQAEKREEQQGRLNRAPGGRDKGTKEGESGLGSVKDEPVLPTIRTGS